MEYVRKRWRNWPTYDFRRKFSYLPIQRQKQTSSEEPTQLKMFRSLSLQTHNQGFGNKWSLINLLILLLAQFQPDHHDFWGQHGQCHAYHFVIIHKNCYLAARVCKLIRSDGGSSVKQIQNILNCTNKLSRSNHTRSELVIT